MPEKPVRKPQPVCSSINENGNRCSHPISFHSGKVGGPCKALGCHCSGFVPTETPTDVAVGV